MRIFAVTPIHVSAEELARRQARYDALSPDGLSVHLEDIGPDAPRALDTEEQVRASDELVTAALERAAGRADGIDAVMPDCVLDPGVARLAGRLERPVFGLLRTSLAWGAITGRPVGAVTRNKAIAEELRRQVEGYGMAGSFTGVEVLDLDVDAIHDAGRWAASLHEVVERMGEAGAGDLLNGCSAVDLPPEAAQWPVRVVDPTALALRLIAAGALA